MHERLLSTIIETPTRSLTFEVVAFFVPSCLYISSLWVVSKDNVKVMLILQPFLMVFSCVHRNRLTDDTSWCDHKVPVWTSSSQDICRRAGENNSVVTWFLKNITVLQPIDYRFTRGLPAKSTLSLLLWEDESSSSSQYRFRITNWLPREALSWNRRQIFLAECLPVGVWIDDFNSKVATWRPAVHLCFKLILMFSLAQISSSDLEPWQSDFIEGKEFTEVKPWPLCSFPSMKSLCNSFTMWWLGGSSNDSAFYSPFCDDVRHFSKVRFRLVIIM